jgi:hypothetical protein
MALRPAAWRPLLRQGGRSMALIVARPVPVFRGFHAARPALAEEHKDASAEGKAPEAPSRFRKGVAFAWEVLKESVGLGSSSSGPTSAGSGVEDYPWVEFQHGGRTVYRNKTTGEVVEDKPEGFDKYGAAMEADTSTMALTIVEQKKTRWDTYREMLEDSAFMRALSSARRAVMASETAGKLQDASEAARAEWETSQNPLVYQAASAYETLFGETEQARAFARIQELDPHFTGGPEFIDECRNTIIPSIVSALLRGSRVELDGWCTDDCMARVNAVLRARESEALTVDATILSTSQVTLAGAKVLETGPPMVLVTGMVQQLHCIRNKSVSPPTR